MKTLALILLMGCLPSAPQLAPQTAAQRDFLALLERINRERQRVGLHLLDTCSEKFKFDPAWAAEDRACRERIRRFRAGDRGALDTNIYLPTVQRSHRP
jgi:hypothetical protein